MLGEDFWPSVPAENAALMAIVGANECFELHRLNTGEKVGQALLYRTLHAC